MSDRVLVTGVTGFVGSHVLRRLLDRFDSPCVVGVGSLRNNGTADRVRDVLEAVPGACYAHLTHDLTAPLSSLQMLTLQGVEKIVHVASRCSVDESIRDPEGFVRNNVDLQLTVLDLARRLGVDRFVHLSTDEVYGPHEPDSLQEHRPSSPYAASKAAQLDLCGAYASTFGVPVSVLASVNMMGERQSQLAFIPRIVRALLSEEPVTVHVRDGVPGGRNYVYVGDVADTLIDLAYSDGDSPRYEVVSGASYVDNLDLVQRVARVLDVEPRIELVEASTVRPGHDFAYGLETNVAPPTPFNAALRKTVTWFTEHPQWLV